ncbi:MAG: DUF3488 domain-containing protein, partial [Magnetococcales bacterium]|nr:DUF3488 domain-containing protein [Magnetococcales bacterium]
MKPGRGGSGPWLVLMLLPLAASLPHFSRLPWAFSALCVGTALFWGWGSWVGGGILRFSGAVRLGVILAGAGVILEEGGGLGILEMGAGFLSLLLLLRLPELESPRRGQMIVSLSFFLACAAFFRDQSLATTLFLAGVGVLVVAGHASLTRGAGLPRGIWQGGRLLLQALPWRWPTHGLVKPSPTFSC